MARRRLPFRDPRTVARDIPGVLDILFPRLSGGLVGSLNKTMFSFEGLTAISDEIVDSSKLRKAMLFELSMARAEGILANNAEPDWNSCLQIAAKRQRRHYDAQIPDTLEQCDLDIASHAAHNLVEMLNSIQKQKPKTELQKEPPIPGLGWIASGHGDFSLGPILIEVKHTNRNFVSRDFRQVLMYWLLKYAASVESNNAVWTDCILLNPRRNSALLFKFDYLLSSASAGSTRIELLELMHSIIGYDFDRR